MESHPHRPLVNRNTIEVSLEAMRLGQPLGEHPLKYFLSIRDHVVTPQSLPGETAFEFAVFDYLTACILDRLASVRNLYQISPPDRLCSQIHLEADFQAGNPELEAWSVLYHRYVCIDHNLSSQEIAARVNVDARTIRRRQQVGFERLTQYVIRREQRYRHEQTGRRLRLALPVSQAPWLVNADTLLPPAHHMLCDAEPPHHLLLYGPPGIGKTALAKAIAHTLINQQTLDDLVWVDAALTGGDAAALTHEIATRLGLPQHHDAPYEESLRAYLLMHSVLVVLDSAEALLQNAQQAELMFDRLDSAFVVLTSRRLAPGHLWFYELPVPALTREQALDLLDRTTRRDASGRITYIDRFDAIWQTAGGNPLALRILGASSPRSSLPDALSHSEIERLYTQVWHDLLEPQRRLWLLALFFPREAIPQTELIELASSTPQTVVQHLNELVSLALLDVTVQDDNTLYYMLEPVCASFLKQVIQQDVTVGAGKHARAALRDVLPVRLEQLLQHRNASAALHLLHTVDLLDLEPAVEWQLARDLALQITGESRWSAWKEVLHKIERANLDQDQHAWVFAQIGTAQRWLGQLEAAYMSLTRALNAYAGDNPERIAAWVELAIVHRYLGRWHDTRRLLADAFAYYQQHDDMQGVRRCVHELAQLDLDALRPAEAIAWLSRLDRWAGRTWALASQCHLALGQLDHALEAAERALKRSAPMNPNHARTLVTLGQIYDARGDDPAAAVRYLLAGVDLLNQNKDMLGYARACNNLAMAYRRLSEAPRSLEAEATSDDPALRSEMWRLLREAEAIQSKIGDELGLAVTHQNMQWLHESTPQDDTGTAIDS